ncbi:MAG: TadE/TadG family type IV pilus assembly protein [Thermogutta sp.]
MRFATALSLSLRLLNCVSQIRIDSTKYKRTQQRLRPQRPPHSSYPGRAGVAVVEFAVVAPLFFLLILGMIEFGRMVMVQQVITNASREGARTAIVQGATTSDVVGTVNNYLTGGGVRGATVSVSPDPIDLAGYGDPVTVTVSVPFRQVSWLPAPMFLKDTELRATTTMRREAVQ